MFKRAYNWTKDKIKRAWKWVLGVVGIGAIAIAATTGSPNITNEQGLITAISQIQEQHKTLNGKYRQFKRNENIGGINLDNFPYDIEIHEYVSPSGPGYQIILTREVVTASSSYKQTRAIGHGPKADSFSWDWK